MFAHLFPLTECVPLFSCQIPTHPSRPIWNFFHEAFPDLYPCFYLNLGLVTISCVFYLDLHSSASFSMDLLGHCYEPNTVPDAEDKMHKDSAPKTLYSYILAWKLDRLPFLDKDYERNRSEGNITVQFWTCWKMWSAAEYTNGGMVPSVEEMDTSNPWGNVYKSHQCLGYFKLIRLNENRKNKRFQNWTPGRLEWWQDGEKPAQGTQGSRQ